MLYNIENEKLLVTVSSSGAELMHIIGKDDGCEYLWQGDDKYWAKRAILVFPVCGRLFEKKYLWNGKEYEMKNHGFAATEEYTVVNRRASSITLSISDNEKTLTQYPFNFTFEVSYSLSGSTLSQSFTVRCNGDELPFSLGGHPGFNVPLTKGEKFEDYYIEFSEATNPRKILFSPNCFITGKTEPFDLRDGKILDLTHDMFDDDALFFEGSSKKVFLKSKTSKKSIEVSFPKMKYLGLWHKPRTDAPYITIEPWNGLPSFEGKVDDFASKKDMIILKKNEVYRTGFDITVNQ
jgi:galactose mutarotase-like enzyme